MTSKRSIEKSGSAITIGAVGVHIALLEQHTEYTLVTFLSSYVHCAKPTFPSLGLE
jgi:hypothetical protein